jgi:hypothetical protein
MLEIRTGFYLSIYLSVCLSVYVSVFIYSPRGPWPLFQFLNLYTIGMIPRTWDMPVARPLPPHRTTQTQNKHTHTQTSMPWVGFEPTIPVFERAKTVHASECAATVIGRTGFSCAIFWIIKCNFCIEFWVQWFPIWCWFNVEPVYLFRQNKKYIGSKSHGELCSKSVFNHFLFRKTQNSWVQNSK